MCVRPLQIVVLLGLYFVEADLGSYSMIRSRVKQLRLHDYCIRSKKDGDW